MYGNYCWIDELVSHQANANAKDKIAAIYSLDTSPITGLAVYGDLLFIIESLGSTNGVSPLFGFRTTGFDSSDFFLANWTVCVSSASLGN